MRELFFITGNKNKYEEVKAILPEAEMLDIDLPEIQEIDSQKIIEFKIREALKHHKGPFMVEDISFSLDCLGGLPGPLIKWFLKTIGIDGLYSLTQKMDNNEATIKAVIGYTKNSEEIKFFEATIKGKVVAPTGDTSFGFDPIFIPEGHVKTFAQMDKSEKNKVSHRGLAVAKLKEYLDSND